MLNINTNLSSLIVQSSLKQSTSGLNRAIERMTTGFKINHAKDNAAGYSISTNITTKIGAYEVAESNTAMGLDLLNTASESLNLVSRGLERIRALAVQVNNDTYGSESKGAINKEVNSIIDEMFRSYNNTEYNGIDLLKAGETFIKDVAARDTSAMEKISEIDKDTGVLETGKTYAISSADDLEKLAQITNDGRLQTGVEFVLANDIDLSSVTNWTTIGNETNRFTGKFDGNGYIIKNLTVNSGNDNVGFFGSTDNLEVCNLGLEDVNVSGNGYVGGLIGHAHGTTLKINNSYITGSISANTNICGALIGCTDYSCVVNIKDSFTNAATDATGAVAAGFIGISRDNVTIDSCYTTGSCYAQAQTAGGLIGQAGKTTNIQNSYSDCIIGADRLCGGLVGYGNSTDCNLNIVSSYATGNVSTGRYTAGGLVGQIDGKATILNSYATGNITSGTECVGGLVGYGCNNLDITSSYATGNVTAGIQIAGGLVGSVAENGNINITSSYATGDVSSKTGYIGGLLGGLFNNSTATITSCYSTGDVSSPTGVEFAGIIGCANAGTTVTISNCYTTGNIGAAGIIGYKGAGALTIENCHVLGTLYNTDASIVGAYNGGELNITGCSVVSNLQNLNVWKKNSEGVVVTGTQETVAVADGTVPFIYDYDYGNTGVVFDYSRGKENNIRLQIGIHGNDNSAINISTNFTLNELDKLRNIGLDDKTDFLSVIDSLDSTINAKQTEYGAAMNRLESALDEISIQYENLVSTRSTIRDADIAEVSSEYIKMQILQQASATLLATANQTPAIALQLL